MNKLNTQKFMNLFNEILNDRNGVGLAKARELGTQEFKGDEIDKITIQKEHQLNARLGERNILFLKKVQDAKQKILEGTYGTCEDCGSDISQKRLLARPTASLCIQCQEAKERVESHNINHRRDLAIEKRRETESEEHGLGTQKFESMFDIKFESVMDL